MIFYIYQTVVYIYDEQGLRYSSDCIYRIFMLQYQMISAFYAKGIAMLLQETRGCSKAKLFV